MIGKDMTKIKMTKEDLEWQAKADADALMNVEKLKKDKARLKRALKVVQEKISEGQKTLEAAKNIKKTVKVSKTKRKRTVKRKIGKKSKKR